ncbi:hypothetical protein I7I48_06826 [Histoplasma ohiense]|nr:hypothetical protein I7I48_06826 [Histoplasma ohiense (nom. inval.)]
MRLCFFGTRFDTCWQGELFVGFFFFFRLLIFGESLSPTIANPQIVYVSALELALVFSAGKPQQDCHGWLLLHWHIGLESLSPF